MMEMVVANYCVYTSKISFVMISYSLVTGYDLSVRR